MSYCPACGQPRAGSDHARCDERELDPPRWCRQCGRRLDVQIFPTGFRATCRRCDGIHPAQRETAGR